MNVDRAEQPKGENMVYFKDYFTADTQFSKVANALETESHFMHSVHTFHLCVTVSLVNGAICDYTMLE